MLHDEFTAYVQERLRMHRENLRLWESGALAPTEPDWDERYAIQRELQACIHELELLLARLGGQEKEQQQQ